MPTLLKARLARRRRGAALGVALIAAGTVVAAVAAQNASADTGASCTGAYVIDWHTPSDNPPDFGASVTVTNNSPYPITGWTITWTWPAGQSIIPGSPFSAVVNQSGSTVTATPGGSFNANLSP